VEVNILDVQGFDIACEAVRLSFNSKPHSLYAISNQSVSMLEDDYDLLLGLTKNGDSHAKVMRMVQVWLDIKAPRYWWAEWDTYKVGTTAMSESTMHTCTKRQLTFDDFEMKFDSVLDCEFLNKLNRLADEKDWYSLKQHLPESFLQRRIVNLNYQVLRHMYLDRKNHRLPEWHLFLETMLKYLPFPQFITGGE